MALYIWLTVLVMSLLLSPGSLAKQSQWITDLEQSKNLSKYGKDQDLQHSVQYCVKALGGARQLPTPALRSVALDQVREQLQRLQFQFDSASRWDWAEQVTKWLLDIDLKNHQSNETFSLNIYQAAADYGKLAKYALMQGRTAEAEKYAAREKEMKDRPLRQAKQQAAEFQAKFAKQIEAAKEAQAKIQSSGNLPGANPSTGNPASASPTSTSRPSENHNPETPAQ